MEDKIKAAAVAANTAARGYPEVAAIREDLGSLKDNTVELAHRVRDEGAKKLSALGDDSARLYGRAVEKGREGVEKAESAMREHPLQGMAIAFAGGFLASILLRRK